MVQPNRNQGEAECKEQLTTIRPYLEHWMRQTGLF